MTPKTEDTPLNPRQEAFCLAYACYGNAALAAREAGYEQAGARQHGHRLLQSPAIAGRIADIRGRIARDHCRDTDQFLGKLEKVYALALDDHHFIAATRAVEAQARIAGLMPALLRRFAELTRPRFKMLTDVDKPSTSGPAAPSESTACDAGVNTAPRPSTSPSTAASTPSSTRAPDAAKVDRT